VKSRDLIEALLAVLGVYELIQGLSFIAFLIPFGAGAQEADSWPSLSTAIGAAVPIALGGCLLAMRRKHQGRLGVLSTAASLGYVDHSGTSNVGAPRTNI